jgi:N utilization substance protein A
MADPEIDQITRLFTEAVPEIAAGVVQIKAMAREPGLRTKVAVASLDKKVDCVNACVGVRGSRIRNVVDQLGSERIDLFRWDDSLHVLISSALQPARIEEVFVYEHLRRAIVVVKDDQLSLARGRREQNVRLASKLVGRDIWAMTPDMLNDAAELAENRFCQIPDVSPDLAESLVKQGLFSYRDLTSLKPEQLAKLVGITDSQAEPIIRFAAQRDDEEPFA